MTWPCFIDIEASGLHPDSYPIEIAWSLPDGRIDSRLILPDPEWTHWDRNAEAMHGISRGQLTQYGRPIPEVATLVNTALAGQTVYSDSVGHDAYWCRALFDYADTTCDFDFDFGDIVDLIRSLGVSLNDARHYESEAWKQAPRPAHRAVNDVRRLQLWYQAARKRVPLE